MKYRWIVLKFGGTSVTGAENWKRIQYIIQKKIDLGYRVLVVCSALSTISNRLERLANKAAQGNGFTEDLRDIEDYHISQSTALGLSAADVVGDLMNDLKRLSHGASLIEDVSPKLWARILSAGELISTRLGAAWLKKQEVSAHWMDARSVLKTLPQDGRKGYLSAVAHHDKDTELIEHINTLDVDVIVTQGFIGRNQSGETVLLGRGGSDTSAAYFAAKIQAESLEIWTDVPGLFTANPKLIPSARLLRVLDYGEAQELATTGAKALHPRTISPVRKSNIPLRVRSTYAPDLEGTNITHQAQSRAGIKGISSRKGIALVSMDTVGMWQTSGFLADIFAVFKKYGLSIDLVATSEANVTVSLDGDVNRFDEHKLEEVLSELGGYCTPKLIAPVASISLVGRNIRSILHRLGPIFERFADQKVHLMAQAASDLNLTFVVDEDQTDGLLRSLHAKLFSQDLQDPGFGPTWSSLTEEAEVEHPVWWQRERDTLLRIAQNTPCFVYHKATLRQQADNLRNISSLSKIFFAIKANPHPDILRIFHEKGLGFECVSPEEVRHVRSLFPELPKERLLFTPNFAPKSEYVFGFQSEAVITLDSIYPLRKWPSVFSNQEVMIRVDTGKGKGHHKYVVTAGTQSKFGIPPNDFDELLLLTKKYNVKVIGLHAHAGSGITDPYNWRDKGLYLNSLRTHFPDVRILNLGGGFGVPERPHQSRLDLNAVGESLRDLKDVDPNLELWIEPGRYLVAEAGVILSKVTQLKSKGERMYVGLDVGMNTLIRPALYGAWHQIDSLTRLTEEKKIIADLVGPICESGDVLGRGRALPQCDTGDVMIIQTAGAYGRSMSSHYNLRAPATENFI